MESSAFRLRPALPADIPAVFAMKRILAAAAGAAASLRASERDWLRDAFGAAPKFHIHVAEAMGEIVGMAAYGEVYMTALGGPVFAIQDLFVAPRWRRHGVGRALAAAIAAAALAASVPLIELNVAEDNAARKFYRQLGFQHLKECLTYAIGGEAMRALSLEAEAPAGIAPARRQSS